MTGKLICSVGVDGLNRSLDSLGEIGYTPVTMIKHDRQLCILLAKQNDISE